MSGEICERKKANSDVWKSIYLPWADFIPDERWEDSGIIRYLTERSGGNVHEKGVVCITSSGCSSGSAEAVLNLGSGDFFESTEMGDPWLIIDFKEMSVIPSSYYIGKHTDARSSFRPPFVLALGGIERQNHMDGTGF